MASKPEVGLEKDFQRRVVEFAELQGWRVFNVPDSRRVTVYGETAKGYPDLCMVQNRTLLFIELKMPGKKPSDDQKEWQALLDDVRVVQAYTCWPKDEKDIRKGLKRRGR